MQELLPRNLYTLDKAKISPAGRNDINDVRSSTFNGDIAKGKDHKQYEYGNKSSIASTAKTNIIVGVVIMNVTFMITTPYPKYSLI